MERVADYVISRLTESGIKHIFLITGRGILYLTDAVARNKDIKGISTYHEQGASYAAMAYASATDGMAACLVSTGCAATNAVTAALCAYQDNLPVIFISGQNMLEETTRHTGLQIRTYGSQEADIISVVEPITKYAVMLEHADEVKTVTDQAFFYANEGRKGPVWIDIPLDIQNARVEPEKLTGWISELYHKNDIGMDVEFVTKKLNHAKRPLLFVGGGVRGAGAVAELSELVQKAGIPVVFSSAACDAYGSGNELSIGAVGSLGGSRAGNFAVQNADFILALGSKMCLQTTGDVNTFAREADIVVVDVDPIEHTKAGINFARVINADAKVFLKELLRQEIRSVDSEWVLKCKHWKDIFAVKNEEFEQMYRDEGIIDLYHFADVLSDKLLDDATLITDAGLEELIIPSTIRFRDGQRCLFPAAQGAMGYAIPATLGAYYAGRHNIVAVVGDGSFMMNMQELLAISTQRIPAKIFVINNNMYAVIRKRQKDLFRNRTIGNDPSDGVAAPNFRKIADSFDIKYIEISGLEDMETGIERVLNLEETCICEVHCADEQKYLHMSFAINEARKLVKRPQEDLSPFIDRELLRSEMIIAPIEE